MKSLLFLRPALLSLGIIALNVHWLSAATFDYTGPGGTTTAPLTGTWNDIANWNGGVPVSNKDTVLTFGGSASGTYTAANDFAGDFTLNRISLGSSSSGLSTLTGGTLNFLSNTALALPRITQNGSGAFEIGSAIKLGNTLVVDGSGLGSVTLSGVISGSNSLTMAGAGDLIVTGQNTFTGAANINSGRVIVAQVDQQLGLGGLAFGGGTLKWEGSMDDYDESNAIITVNAGGGTLDQGNIYLTLSGTISGAGQLTKAGAADLYLSANSASFSGGIRVTAGTLYGMSATRALGSGAVTLAGGNLELDDNLGINFGNVVTVQNSATISSGRTSFGAGVTQTLGALNIGAQTLTISKGTGVNSGTAGITFTGSSALTGTGATSTLSANADTLLTMGILGTGSGTGVNANTLIITGAGNTVLGGVVSGSGNLIKNGAGLLTITANNIFTGNVALNAGTVRAVGNNPGLLGAGVSALTLAGGSLELANTANLTLGRNTTVSTNTTITSDRSSAGAGVTYTFGTLAIGAQTLTLNAGSNVTSGTAGLTFGATTLTGNATFSPSVNTLLTLGAVSGAGRNLTFTGAGNSTVSGIIGTTTGNLVKSGSGTLTLSGANTFSGGVTLNDGTIVLGNAAGLGTGTANLVSGSLLSGISATVTNNLNVTTDNVIFGSTAVTANTYSGTYSLGVGSRTLTFNSVVTTLSGAAITLPGDLTLNGTGGATFTNGFTLGGSRVLTFNQAGVATIGAITLAANPLTVQGSGTSVISGVLTGSGALTKSGSGNLTLSGANGSYTGVKNLNAGTLTLGSVTALGTGALTINGGFLDVNAVSTGSILVLTTNNAQNWNGDFGYRGTSFLSGNNTIAPSLNLGTGAVTLGGTRQVFVDANTLTVGGVISGAVGYGLIKTGGGTLTLTGANTYTGKTTINGGNLSVASLNNVSGGTANSNLGAPNSVANGTIDLGGGILAYTGAAATTDRVINLSGTNVGGAIDASGSGAIKFTSNLTTTGTGAKTFYLQGSSTANNEFAGVIGDRNPTDLTSLTKAGSGTWVLSGANTYSGKTTINGGILKVSSINSVIGGAASSNLGAPITAANGTIDINRGTLSYTGTGETTDRVINMLDLVTLDNAGSGTLVFTGGVTSTGYGAKTLTVQNGTSEISGVISENSASNPTSVTKANSGIWTLSGNNTYSGKTSITNGTLRAYSLNSVVGGTASSSLGAPVTVLAGTIDFGGGNASGALVYLGTGETTDRVINLAGTTGGAIVDQSGTGLLKFTSDLGITGLGSKNLTFQGSTAGSGEMSGIISDNSALNQTSVVKSGTGTWTLSGANTYTGATTISAGTLILTGANTSTGLVSVNTGNLLIQGSGTLGASTVNVAVSTGTLDLGGTSQTIGALSLTNTGATVQNGSLTASSYAISSPGAATISASLLGSGALTKTGVGTLSITGTNTYTGSTTVTGGGLTLSGATTGTLNSSSTFGLNGGALTLDNTLGSLERLNNSANVILSQGGSLNLVGHTAGVTETITNLEFGSGNGIVTITPAASGMTTLAASSLVRSGNGTGVVRGTNLGGTGTLANMTLTTAPSGVNFVGAGGAPTGVGTSKNLAIVPWLVGGILSNSNGSAFVTYDTVGGLRPLDANEQDTLAAAYNTVGNNVKSSGAITLTNAVQSFNSLFMAGGTLNGAGAGSSLTLTSGALATTNTAILNSFGAGIIFGNDEAVITTIGGMTINSSINVTGGGGLTKAGSSILLLTGSQAYTGATTVNQGTLQLDNTTVLATSGINTAVGGITNFNIGSGTSTLAAPLSGGGSFTKTGGGTLALSGSGAGTGTGAGTFTIGSSSGFVRLDSANALQNLTATNNGANGFTFASGIGTFNVGGLSGNAALSLLDASSGAVTLQAGNNNADTTFSGVLSGAGASLVKVGTGTLNLSAANTFTGGLVIKNGTVQATTSGTALGAGSVTLGDSAGGSNNATMLIGFSSTFANPIILAANTTGTLTVATTGNTTVPFSGGVTGTNNLTIDNRGNSPLTFITNAVNNSGSILNAGAGTGAVTISGGVGSNVTAITQNSLFSSLTIGSAQVVNSGGTTLTNNSLGSAVLLGNSSNAIAGTGNLILKNNTSLANGISLAGAVNNVGSITNSGTGTGNVTVSGAIGSNVTNVVQNSANSSLTLSGANTFSGNATVLNGTMILGGATSAGTNQILLGASGGSANASLVVPNASNSVITIANAIRVQNNSGISTLASSTTRNGVTFSGLITLDKDLVVSAYNAPVTLNSLTGVGGITVLGTGLSTTASGQPYGVSAANVLLTQANSFQGDVRVLAGALTLSTTTAASNADTWLGIGTNAVLVGDTSGTESARLLLSSNTTGQIFSRAIKVQAGNGGISAVGSTSNSNNNFSAFSSAITLDKSVYLTGPSTFNGSISKGGSAHGAVSVTTMGTTNSSLTTFTGAKIYDGGTTVGLGTLVGSTGVLGSGNVVAETGAFRLDATTNVASGRTVTVGPLGELIIGATGITQSDLETLVSPSSSGGLGIATGVTYTASLDLATIGNGRMFLGSQAYVGGSSTYNGVTLGANSDGNYRLGWGGVNSTNGLTIGNSVLVDNGINPTAQLIVGGAAGAIGYSSSYSYHTEGYVLLSKSNAYSGGTIVNSNSYLAGTQGTVDGTNFGTGSMTLHNSTLHLNNTTGSTAGTTVGALSFDGYSSLTIKGDATGINTLVVGPLTRTANGTLIVNVLSGSSANGILGTNAIIKTTGSLSTTTVATDTVGGTSAMVAPYITDVNGNYLTYDATSGFTPITTSISTIDGSTPTNALVKTVATGVTTIDGSATIAALSLAGNFLSSVVGDITLTITTGGITNLGYGANASSNSGMSIGSTTNRINFDFNGKEAVIFARANQNGGMIINGALNNTGGNGLTKSGTGNLSLISTASTFTGLVTINAGSVTVSNDLVLGSSAANGSLSNGLYINGGAVIASISNSTVTLNENRVVTIGEAGAALVATGGNNNGPNYANLTILGKMTGTGGFLSLYSPTSIETSIIASTFTFSNLTNDFVAPIYIGSLNSGRVDLAFDDNRQLGNASNAINFAGGNAQLKFTGTGAASMNRGLSFSDMGGGIEVANATATLTSNGTISGSGMFNKNGSGRLVLNGSANNFSGSVNVNAGVVRISHGEALGATTAAIASGTSGVSGEATYVQNGAALEVVGGIAIGGTGGKTLYLNGSGVANAGALRNVSGNNSNVGSLILQTNTTIGSDAGRYTASGVVSGSGALTKVGTGALEFSGANTYTGGTNVSVGTLVINNTIGSATGTGAVLLSSIATLAGSGHISGLVTTGGTTTVISPGNSLGTLTLSGGLNATNGATFNFELGNSSDEIDLESGLLTGSTGTGGMMFNFLNSGGLMAGNPYTLFLFGASSGFDYADLVANVVPSGYVMDTGFGNNGFLINGNSLQAQFALIPEPSSASLLLMGAGLGFLAWRKRKVSRA